MASSGPFLDEVDIDVASGAGGHGAVSFRREKYVPAGGPDGGDGGAGGDVVLLADSGDATLSSFRERRTFRAENGSPGAGGRRTGRDGEELAVHVPPGTVVREGDRVLADLDTTGARLIAARGGRGGRGNARFATPTRRAPRLGELGEPGERHRLHLELKLIADVGLVGLPNAGKSTLLAALTGAHPKIGAYPFTTLHPNLGVANAASGHTLLIADVPGLIAGAHEGAGLGLDFLRHIERTRVLVHVVDVSNGEDEAERAIEVIRDELREFSAALIDRPVVLALNKVDVPGAAGVAERVAPRHPGAVLISAATGDGVDALLGLVEEAVARSAAPPAAAEVDPADHRTYAYRSRSERPVVPREDGAFRVHAKGIERLVARTDLDSDDAVARLQRTMRRAGVDDALRAAGASDGDTVRIGDNEFIFSDEALP
ncbi:MAG: GTPase ObgE [Candidatus Dormibacteria bacterium]